MSSDMVLTVVPLIRVVPAQLPRGLTISKLPRLLDRALAAVAPSGLDVGGYYLVEQDYRTIRTAVNRLATPYHDYAVEVLGDQCTQASCDKHVGLAPVVPLFSRGGV